MPRPKRKTSEFFQEGTRSEIDVPVSANALTRHVIEYLTILGCKAWRNQSGALKVEGKGNARGRYVRFGQKGSADILAVLPPLGRLIAVEIKAGKDRIRPEQQAWLDEIESKGGISIVARSIDDVMERIAKELEVFP